MKAHLLRFFLAQKRRICPDCGVDISDLHGSCKRCKACQAKKNKNDHVQRQRKYEQDNEIPECARRSKIVYGYWKIIKDLEKIEEVQAWYGMIKKHGADKIDIMDKRNVLKLLNERYNELQRQKTDKEVEFGYGYEKAKDFTAQEQRKRGVDDDDDVKYYYDWGDDDDDDDDKPKKKRSRKDVYDDWRYCFSSSPSTILVRHMSKSKQEFKIEPSLDNKDQQLEYIRIKARIIQITNALHRAARKNKDFMKLDTERRMKALNELIIKTLAQEFGVKAIVVLHWLLFDYFTDITRPEIERMLDSKKEKLMLERIEKRLYKTDSEFRQICDAIRRKEKELFK